ncbi:MAG: alpha/beta fold hydrolase [Anaerolineae bacterium]|nr:MAG: alpha/beta fold hydrolase [Anaerolineae bacterium]
MNWRRIFRLTLAYLGSGISTLLTSILLETFLFRPVVKARHELFPWNRELNALSLILATIIGGAIAVRLARDKQKRSPWLVLFAAGGVATLLWLMGKIVLFNPLSVGWRGCLMTTAGAAAGGSLLIGGRARRIAWSVLCITLAVGFGTVRYDFYEFHVTIPSDRALLRGEVIVPGRRAGVTYPAVLLVHDLGQQDRDEVWGVNRPFREIAEHLALNGYVVLRYDKRGCGESGGVFIHLGLEDFARDVVSAGALLAGQREVKGQPVFVVGHGTGGWAATLAAQANPDLFAGLVLLATPAGPLSDWLRAQHRYALTTLGAAPAEAETRLAAVDDWVEGVDTRQYMAYGDYFGSRGISEDLQAEQHITPLPPVWLRQAMAHDQATALASLPLPVLILVGEADWRVPPSEAEALADALETTGRSDWELRLLPGVYHRLVAVESMEAGFRLEQTDAYAEERHPVASTVLDALIDWLGRKVGKK